MGVVMRPSRRRFSCNGTMYLYCVPIVLPLTVLLGCLSFTLMNY